jgi:hypothetical protein
VVLVDGYIHGSYWSLRCGCPDSDPEHAAEFGQGLSDTVRFRLHPVKLCVRRVMR